MRNLNAITTHFLAACVLMAATPVLAALDCQVLKQRTFSNIQSKGVKSFSLNIVDINEVAEGKVVGTCGGGQRKVIYLKHTNQEPDYPKERPWHDALENNNQSLALPSITVVEVPQQDKQAYAKMDIPQLIESMHQTRNESLYYNSGAWPENMQKLSEIGVTSHEKVSQALIDAYKAEQKDGVFRFNVVCLLNQILLRQGNFENSQTASQVAEHLALATQDENSWVRTEAVWGLRFFHHPKYAPVAEKLLNDSDANVAKEAKDTYDFLKSINR
jgi:Protein of unknown function (DUF1161)